MKDRLEKYSNNEGKGIIDITNQVYQNDTVLFETTTSVAVIL